VEKEFSKEWGGVSSEDGEVRSQIEEMKGEVRG
jgi:hypothetical protein